MDELHEKIVLACRIMDGTGLTEGFGHVSARIPGTDRVLITPAMGPGRVTPDVLLIFTLDGKCLDAQTAIPPALETPMHLAVYRARSDVGAICRTHSRYAVIMGAAGKPVHPCHGFGGMLGPLVPVHPETDLIVNAEMGDQVAKALDGYTALLLRGNGALVTGADVERAVVHAIYLEEAARIELSALAVGGAVLFTPDELRNRQRWYGNEARRAWDYYVWKYARESQ
jgi:ribulose-5-phosphate 4-epimerase/fuculose-1-phosphate aldolase